MVQPGERRHSGINVSDTSCQLANSTYFADQIVDLFFEIWRASCPAELLSVHQSTDQFFCAVSDWIFMFVPNARPYQPPMHACGPATSSGDGYFARPGKYGLRRGN